MTPIEVFVDYLITQGYVERRRLENLAPKFLGEANYQVSMEHPQLGWSHVSKYVRGKRTTVQCILHPRLLGERTVHTKLGSVQIRLGVIRSRFESGPTKVWSEKTERKRATL